MLGRGIVEPHFHYAKKVADYGGSFFCARFGLNIFIHLPCLIGIPDERNTRYNLSTYTITKQALKCFVLAKWSLNFFNSKLSLMYKPFWMSCRYFPQPVNSTSTKLSNDFVSREENSTWSNYVFTMVLKNEISLSLSLSRYRYRYR